MRFKKRVLLQHVCLVFLLFGEDVVYFVDNVADLEAVDLGETLQQFALVVRTQRVQFEL